MQNQRSWDQRSSLNLDLSHNGVRAAWPISSGFYLAGMRPAWEAAFPTDVEYKRSYV